MPPTNSPPTSAADRLRAAASFNSESQRFLRFNLCQKSSQFYDAERLLLFGFATCALATLASDDDSGKTTIRADGGSRCSYSH
jgi:hypothetical protein